MLRPLRIVLPSERVRSARIVLLKATHAPFIAAIWAYEHFAGRTKAGAVSINGPETPTATPNKSALRSSMNPPRPLVSGISGFAESSGNGSGRLHSANRPYSRGSPSDGEPQLKALVLKLSAQVEQLTAVIREQRDAEASMAA